MDQDQLRTLFEQVRAGAVDIEAAMGRMRHMPFEDLGFAKVDHHRALRHGMPEVIFAQGKTPEQVVAIAESLLANAHNVLITRAGRECAALVTAQLPGAEDLPLSGVIRFWRDRTVRRKGRRARGESAALVTAHPPGAEYLPLSGVIRFWRDRTVHGKGRIAVVCAGTSDIPVAEEAQVTAELMGNDVDTIHDIGVAGIHRLMSNRERLSQARVVVVCAGMEGALPSVVGGLVSVPVIAVPTSIGYGSSFHGLAALLGMLNSCASNVTVVNIDNGFGAGYVASLDRKSTRLNSSHLGI